VADRSGSDDEWRTEAGRGPSHVEEEAVDLGIGPPSGYSQFSPMGSVEAARRIGSSSAVQRPGWRRNVLLLCILGIPAVVVLALLIGLLH
jgi:hypothetical protein